MAVFAEPDRQDGIRAEPLVCWAIIGWDFEGDVALPSATYPEVASHTGELITYMRADDLEAQRDELT